MKIGKRQLSFILVFIVVAVGVAGFIYYQNLPREIRRYNFYGTELEFRNDLRKAENVSVYPDEESVLRKVWNPDISKINIAYVPTNDSSDENSIIALNAFEIRFKLDTAYRNPNFNWVNEFTSTELMSFDEIQQSNDTLVIALVRPSLADGTAVELDGNVVYVKGKSQEELDLATIKFLMSALNITV